ncbi:MAG: acyltransferase [Crocinitomicaceae bacterium]
MIKTFLKKILSNRLRKRLALNEPQMIYGYKIPGQDFHSTRVSNSTVIVNKENLKLGNHVFIGHYNFIESSNGITIKDGTQITNYISILSHSSHISIRLYGENYQKHDDLVGYKKGKVEIGEYTFIGPHSTILPNSKVGKGSLIKPYTLVKGVYPPFSIIEGNPGIVVGSTKDIDKKYLESNPELKVFYNQWAEEKK